jgi:hypothetical protein
MPPGSQDGLRFHIIHLLNTALRERGCRNVYTYHAVIGVDLAFGPKRVKVSEKLSLPFRLDTETFVSVIPAEWLAHRKFTAVRRALTAPLKFATAAGQGTGQLARDALVRFPGDDRDLHLDFLVTPNLNGRRYGLLALRDVIDHFAVETVGSVTYRPTGEPEELPDLVLHHR